MQYIDFDPEALIGKLNIFEKTQLNYAGGQALKRLGYELRQDVIKHMDTIFDRPVPFTLKSLSYNAEGLMLTMHISQKGDKGQDPGRYLYPVSTQDTTGKKPAYPTRFAKALIKNSIVDSSYFPIPWLDGRAVPTNSYGNVPAGFYQTVLAGLKRYGVAGDKKTKSPGFQFFSIPDRRTGPNIRGGKLKQGIYRVKGRQLDYLFGYVRRPPLVPTIFDLYGFIQRRSDEIFPTLLRQELDKALR
jgi:hypothetical protein